MPAALFSALKDIILHCLVPIDISTLETLKDEEYLLVHGCPVTGENDYKEEFNEHGEIILAGYSNFRVRWSVDADALALAGLANYHPGAALSVQKLEFLNSSRNCFQMGEPDSPEKMLIYESPRQDPVAGDLVRVTFDVVARFGPSSITSVLPPAPTTGGGLVPVVGTHWSDVYGVFTIWTRKLDLTGPVSARPYTPYNGTLWYSQNGDSAFPDVPVDLAAFLAAPFVGAESPGENEFGEIFSAASDTYFFPPSATTGAILSKLKTGTPLPDPPTFNFLYGAYETGTTPGAPEDYSIGQGFSGTATTAAEFMEAIRGAPGAGYEFGDQTVCEIYDIHAAAWLTL